jgi:microcystin degradation protein MlrC
MRVGIVGILHESTMRSPRPTDAGALAVFRGQEIVDRKLWLLEGAVDRLMAEKDIEVVPLVYARALPGGPIAADAYRKLKAEALTALREQGPFDGILCANHGAMEVEGLGVAGDTDFISAVRAAVGDIPIATPFDMHGQLTPELLKAMTVFSVLRTAPHRDHYETAERAADMLVRVMRSGARPHKAVVRLPLMVPGEKAMTLYPPGKELFGNLAEFESRAAVMAAGIFVGFGWNDLPWAGMQAVAIADDAAAAKSVAQEIARSVWGRRHDFQLRMPHAEVREGLLQASTLPKPAYVSDSGDNVTAGAGGDLTFVLQTALGLPQLRDLVIAGIWAPGLVERCRKAGIGARVTLPLGDEHWSAPRQLLEATGVVEAVESKRLTQRMEVDLPTNDIDGWWAAVRFGGVLATFHENRTSILSPDDWRAFGIDPLSHQAYVVKVGYLMPSLADACASLVLLLSEGVTALDLSRLTWKSISRPRIPIDPEADWDIEASTFVA